MGAARREMHFGVFVLGTGNHSAGWRHEAARRENMTQRDLYNLTAAARGHWVLYGTPKRIADTLASGD